MKCPVCAAAVRPGLRFCDSCGARLEKACAGCGATSPLGARFCGTCGAPFADSEPHADAGKTAPARSAEEGERRQLTVMFVDLVGSTGLAGSLDPEQWRDILRAYQGVCAEAITRFGGKIQQYAGDGVFAYFGYPVAYDDAARRAVHAGHALLAGVHGLASTTRAQYSVDLQARVGLHTGLVVVGEMGAGETRESGAIVGETPNIASRVQSLARPGTLALSAATKRLVEPAIRLRSLGRHALKGVAEPLELFEALEDADERVAPAESGRAAPLVGRDLELNHLLERWSKAKTGDGHAVLLSGEGGIGKSRLLAELRERVAPDGRAWRALRCSPFHQNSALQPMIDLIERGLATVPDDHASDRLGKLERLLRPDGLDDPATVSLFAALIGASTGGRDTAPELPPEERKKRTMAALLSWLAADAQRQPLVIVVEDLHWMDASTRELLGLVLEQLASLPVLAVFTFRPEFVPAWAPSSRVTTLPLGRLVREDIESLAQATTSGRALPEALLDEIVARTDGVPLFVEELCKALLAAGVVIERNGRLELARALKGTEIPATLRDSLTARLDRLGGAKAVAQLASVLGRDFGYPLLRAVSDAPDPGLDAQLAVLTRAEILLQRGLPPNAHYVFKHALIQEAAYDTLLKSSRLQHHRRVAQTYLARFVEEARANPEVVAHHFSHAGMPPEAIEHWQKAGELAESRSGYAEAIGHFNSALELLALLPQSSDRDRRELSVRVKLGSPLLAAKGLGNAEAGSNYARACEISEGAGDSPERFMALWGDWIYKLSTGQLERAASRADDLVVLSQRLGDTDLVLQAHHSRWSTFNILGRAAIVRADTQQGIRLYDRQRHHHHAHIYGGHDPGVCGLGQGAISAWLTGHPDEAGRLAEDAMALGRDLGHPFSQAVGLWFASYTFMFRGDSAKCRTIADEMLELSRRHALKQTLAIAPICSGWARIDSGETGSGLKLLEQGLEDFRSLGQRGYLPQLLCVCADAHIRAAGNARAFELLAEALNISEQTKQGFFRPEMLRLQADVALALGRTDAPAARSQLEAAMALAREQAAVALEWRAACSLARLLKKNGELPKARELLQARYGAFSEGLDTRDLRAGKELLEELSRQAGQPTRSPQGE
ncbi:MAG: AAA family ATPase [Pseudomonadota bacterium]